MKFINDLAKIINTGQSRSMILHGNIHDLFYNQNKMVPLTTLLLSKTKVERSDKNKGITQIIYQVNRPIEIIGSDNLDELETLWSNSHGDNRTLKSRLSETLDNSVYALELLRQITECARVGKYKNNLLIIVEAADMLLPESPINNMMPADRKRVSIVTDWFSDPQFNSSHDTVILISESRNGIQSRVSRLPQVLTVEIGLPDLEERKKLIEWYLESNSQKADSSWLATNTSGLSLQAVLQLLRSQDYNTENVASKVEQYMESQLGEGVVEFKRPTHKLNDVVGFTRIKKFIAEELIPGFKSNGVDCIAGALVGGPIGSGKTFICEAVASEVGCPVIVLKNIRSKWYGETDQIIERLRRLIESFHKIMIFVDEADTMFGGISSEQDVERRLTGSIQTMMSDASLRGRVIWFLMTARVHLLSPDIRRPGRMDLIIPILDPDEDQEKFVEWVFGELGKKYTPQLMKLTKGMSAASFGMIRSRLKAKPCSSIEQITELLNDMLEPDIQDVRRFQTLQALLNCTRRSLIVDKSTTREQFEEMRSSWKKELTEFEKRGVK